MGGGQKCRKILYGMIVHPSFLGFLGTPHPKNPTRDAFDKPHQSNTLYMGNAVALASSFFIAFACLPAEAAAVAAPAARHAAIGHGNA